MQQAISQQPPAFRLPHPGAIACSMGTDADIITGLIDICNHTLVPWIPDFWRGGIFTGTRGNTGRALHGLLADSWDGAAEQRHLARQLG